MTAGAVTSEHHLATQIGLDALEKGGSAADALVATVIAVNTLCCYHSDIGGSGFALVRQGNRELYGLDFRGTAPVSSCRTETV
jgi:gamma-glutamyltranspeptidase/glutathione hydrolase